MHFMDAKGARRHECEVEPLAKQTAEIVKTEAQNTTPTANGARV